MKINFNIPTDGQFHQFCPECNSEKIVKVLKEEKVFYQCENCQGVFPRLIIIDPKIKWWVDDITKEYWHEVVGVFVFNEANKALFFERTHYPFVFTIPAGHVDVDEIPEVAAKRELLEETGLVVDNLKLIFDDDMYDDKCRRGADSHKWHLFVTKVSGIENIKINNEGLKPVWLSLEEVLKKEITNPLRDSINKYGNKLFS